MENIKNIEKSIFRINTGSGKGSGFYLKEQKLFATNYHVVAGFHEVCLEDNKRNRYVAKVVFINPGKDLALLKAEGLDMDAVEELETIKIDPEITSETRDKVAVLGFPFGMPFTVTEGIISNPSQMLDGRSYIQTDAAVNPGNSGGPMIDEKGNLIGIVSAKFEHADNMGFAIPVNDLVEELEIVSELDDSFSMGCHSCGCVVHEKADYCPNCGADIDESVFEQLELSSIAGKVEEALKQLDVNPVATRSGRDYWNFHQGSAQIRIFIYGGHYLYVTSPLNDLPRKNLADLYTYILTADQAPYRLTIAENKVYLSYRVHLSDLFSLSDKEVINHISGLATKADELDDVFVNEYGAKMTTYSKEVVS